MTAKDKSTKDVDPDTPSEGLTAPRPAIGNVQPNPEPLAGHFVQIVEGEHANQYGVYEMAAERDKNDDPTKVLVRLRDATKDDEYVVVNRDEITETDYLGGR